MKKTHWALFIFLTALQGCILKPEFSEIPRIEFRQIRKIIVNENGFKRDSIIVSVFFQDGDGDLGLSADETFFPYSELKPDGTTNEFFYNYFVTMEKRIANNRYEPIVFSGPNLNGRFFKLNVENTKGPLEGTINRSFTISAGAYPIINVPANSYVRFKIQIADRALNKSNEIITDSLLVNTN
ncbi:MAG: hypothetical protein EAZ55_12830 [Cytophagales bacterium]|nr:MAG: hypothetical protein EAZ55_12830 [Cytophagales bacterium]